MRVKIQYAHVATRSLSQVVRVKTQYAHVVTRSVSRVVGVRDKLNHNCNEIEKRRMIPISAFQCFSMSKIPRTTCSNTTSLTTFYAYSATLRQNEFCDKGEDEHRHCPAGHHSSSCYLINDLRRRSNLCYRYDNRQSGSGI